jgi:V/A-type H+-transporting ATPase subunit I
VIVTMERVRIIGPRPRLDAAVEALQDAGVLHLARPALEPPLRASTATARQRRHLRAVETALDDIEEAMSRLGITDEAGAEPLSTSVEPLAREVWLARRARRAALAVAGEIRAVDDEREDLSGLTELLGIFGELDEDDSTPARRTLYLVLARDALDGLRRKLTEAIGERFTVRDRPLDASQVAVAVVVPADDAGVIDALLSEVGVREVELPAPAGGSGPGAVTEEIARRMASLDERRAALEARRRRLAEWLRPGLIRARAALHDWLIAGDARGHAALTDHLFVLEGWLPADAREALARTLADRAGPAIVIEDVDREQWTSPDVPVAIRNPPMFRPFEVITRRLPSPRYGTMDPTPFVAVFFPMFFGLILGDIGYGAVLAGLAALGWTRSRPGSTLRAVSQVAAACALFSIAFGVAFGELFGNLGHRVLGLHALSFSREDAVVPFLVLAVSIGFVHVVLGLVLGALSGMRSDPRHSLGRGLTAFMLVLTAGVLLAAVNVLPAAFFGPSVVALLVSFPVLIVLEGFVGPIELLSRLGNILSYARIMALGTASVMLATVANEMVGAFGGAVVGVLFATLFHVVNFGLGVFSPTVHALRLHFVEFFGTFYSPGGQVYQPLRHWRSTDASAPQSA